MPADLPSVATHWFRQTDKRKGIRLDADQMDAELAQLATHWIRQTQRGTGIHLSPAQLALLNELGVGDLIREHAEFAENPRDFPSLIRSKYCLRRCGTRVYFAQAGESGPVKIGISKDPLRRLAGLQTDHHDTLHLRASVVGDRRTERDFQAFYRREHLRGEWFRPSLRLMAFMQDIAA